MVNNDLRGYIGKKQTRTFETARSAIDIDARTVELAFASEEEYERYFGIEVLGHGAGEVRMPESVPLCVEHDTGRQIGVCENLNIGPDSVSRARARFSRRQEAVDELQDIADGIRGKVSVGYIVHEMKLVEERSDGPDVYRVTDWEIVEISLVSIPADKSVGVGKSKEFAVSEDIKADAVVGPTETPAVEVAPEVVEPVAEPEVKAEARPERRNDAPEILEIRDMAVRANVPNAAAIADNVIRSGGSVADYRKLLKEADVATEIKTPEIGLTEKEQKRYSFMRLVDALASPTDRKAQERAAFEYECSNAVAERLGRQPQGAFVPEDIQKRDAVVGTASAGGYLKGTDHLSGSFIEALRNRTVVAQAGARFLTGLVGDVAIPKMSAGGTAYWISSEGGAVTESTQTFAQVSMSPKTVGAMTDVSRKLIKRSSPSAEMLIQDDLASILAIAIDLAAISGTGASGQPAGITDDSRTGLGSVTFTSAGAPTYAEVAEIWAEVSKDNALMGSLGWVCDSAMAAYLMTKSKDAGSGQFIYENGQILGRPVFVTEQATTNSLLFGNFNDLIIGQWGVLDLLVDPYTASNTGTVRLVAMQDVDIAVRHEQSFALGNGGS